MVFLTRILFASALLLLGANASYSEDFYTLQFHVAPQQEASLQRLTQLPKIHSTTLSQREHVVLLGHFSSEREAAEQLVQIQRQLEPQIGNFSPLVVRLFRNQSEQLEPLSMARQKRLKFVPATLRAQPTSSHTTLTPKLAADAAVATDYQVTSFTSAPTTQPN
jgi:hypothetical protein